jgi:hypothetical protein
LWMLPNCLCAQTIGGDLFTKCLCAKTFGRLIQTKNCLARERFHVDMRFSARAENCPPGGAIGAVRNDKFSHRWSADEADCLPAQTIQSPGCLRLLALVGKVRLAPRFVPGNKIVCARREFRGGGGQVSARAEISSWKEKRLPGQTIGATYSQKCSYVGTFGRPTPAKKSPGSGRLSCRHEILGRHLRNSRMPGRSGVITYSQNVFT